MPRKIERIVLLGVTSSGKSTVAERLGRRLNWAVHDFDAEIERRAGRTVAEIVAARGEAHFRRLERSLTEEVAARREVVLAPGGGWITDPASLQALEAATFAVWLDVTAEEVLRRMAVDPRPRPLRDHPDPLGAIGALIRERAPLFARADLRIPCDDLSPERVAFEIETLVRMRIG